MKTFKKWGTTRRTSSMLLTTHTRRNNRRLLNHNTCQVNLRRNQRRRRAANERLSRSHPTTIRRVTAADMIPKTLKRKEGASEENIVRIRQRKLLKRRKQPKKRSRQKVPLHNRNLKLDSVKHQRLRERSRAVFKLLEAMLQLSKSPLRRNLTRAATYLT